MARINPGDFLSKTGETMATYRNGRFTENLFSVDFIGFPYGVNISTPFILQPNETRMQFWARVTEAFNVEWRKQKDFYLEDLEISTMMVAGTNRTSVTIKNMEMKNYFAKIQLTFTERGLDPETITTTCDLAEFRMYNPSNNPNHIFNLPTDFTGQ